MFVESEVSLDVSFDAARGRLATLIRGGELLTASQDAYGLDQAALRRVATATIRGFLRRLGTAIASPAPMTGAAGENGRRGPSWRPPETEVS